MEKTVAKLKSLKNGFWKTYSGSSQSTKSFHNEGRKARKVNPKIDANTILIFLLKESLEFEVTFF